MSHRGPHFILMSKLCGHELRRCACPVPDSEREVQCWPCICRDCNARIVDETTRHHFPSAKPVLDGS